MDNIFLLLLMIIIGAGIGGITNSIAIKMLFHPYQPVMLGKWKLPFTPGLIPKRRSEIAEQLGKMVVDHLLTPEGLKKKMEDPAFKQQVIDWMQSETDAFLDRQTPIKDVLKEMNFSYEEETIKEQLRNWTSRNVQEWTHKNRDKKVHQFIQGAWQDKTIQAGVDLVNHLQQQLASLGGSRQAKEKIENLIDNFLKDRGFMANMISSFMGTAEIAEKIQPVLIKYLNSEEMNQLLKEMVGKELSGFLNLTIGEIEEKAGKEEIEQAINGLTDRYLPVDVWMGRPLNHWLNPYRKQIVEEIIPKLADAVGQAASARIETILAQLHLSEIVEKEVANFPISRLEQLLLEISRKEFRMITYLGVLLGGLIGLLQGILVLLIR